MKAITTLGKWFEDHPELLKEWDSESNTHISLETDGYTVNKKAWWICEKGHRYEAMIPSRTYNGYGCPYCTGRKILVGYNDLTTTRPDVLWLWDFEKNMDITPEEVSEFSHKKVWWKCEKGHSWQGRVQTVTSTKEGYTGCPCCSGRLAFPGESDLTALHPEIAAQWCYELNDLKPEDVRCGSRELVWWKCELGHTWQATVKARTEYGKANCPYCTNYKIWPGFNDLATTAPEVAAEWNYEKNGDLKPTEISKNYRKKVWWKCSEGHEWETIVYARTKKNGTGCPVCWQKRNKEMKNKK